MQFLTHYKKTIAWVLAVTMAFSSPMTSFAESEVMVKDSFGSMIDIIPKKAVSVEKDIPLGTEDALQNSDVSTEVATESDTVFAEGEQEFIACSDPVDGIVVTVKAKAGVLPETAGIAVKKIESASTDSEDIEAAVDNTKIIDGTGDETGVQPAGATAFTSELSTKRNILDITILDENGNEIEPDGEVEIKFTLTETVANLTGVRVFHAEDSAEKLTKNAEESEEAEDRETESEGGSELKDTPYVAEELEVIETDDTAVPVEFSVITDSLSPFILECSYLSYTCFVDTAKAYTLIGVMESMGLTTGGCIIEDVSFQDMKPNGAVTITKGTGPSYNDAYVTFPDNFESGTMILKVNHGGSRIQNYYINLKRIHAVVSITDKSSSVRYYEDLKTAIEEFGANDEKITLIDDIVLPKDTRICIRDKSSIVKLDLNGHSITGSYASSLIEVDGGNSTGIDVEFLDSSVNKTGKIINSLKNANAFVINDQGEDNTVKIRITGGYYEGYNAICFHTGEISISGGEFHATGPSGFAIWEPRSKGVNITISNANGIPKFDGVLNCAETCVQLQGGIFSDSVNAKYCDSGYGVFRNEDPATSGMYPYAADALENAAVESTATGLHYKNLQSAFDDVRPGEMLKIQNDITISDGTQITIPDKESRTQITVDLNGKTIKGNYNGELIKSLGTAVEFKNSGTLRNNSQETSAYALGFDGSSAAEPYNCITISGGYYTGYNAVFMNYGGLRVYGGTLEAKDTSKETGYAIGTSVSPNSTSLEIANKNEIPLIRGKLGRINSESASCTGGRFTQPIKDDIYANGYSQFLIHDTSVLASPFYAIDESSKAEAEQYILVDGVSAAVSYMTLAQALYDARNGRTIRLLKDAVDVGVPMKTGQNWNKLTLDLNGFNISGVIPDPILQIDSPGLTIINEKTTGGRIENDYGTAIDYKTRYLSHAQDPEGTAWLELRGNVTVLSGSTGISLGKNTGIRLREQSPVIDAFNGKSIVVENAISGSPEAIVYHSAQLDISAGNIYGLVAISGGDTEYQNDRSNNTGEGRVPGITGGTFHFAGSSDRSKLGTFLADGYTAKPVSGQQGEYVCDVIKTGRIQVERVGDTSSTRYFDDPQSASDDIKPGETLKLLADIDLPQGTQITIPDKNSQTQIVIDLNGHRISGSCSGELIKSLGTAAEFTDSSEDKAGSIINTEGSGTAYAIGFDGGNSGNSNNGIRISYGHYEGWNAVYFRYGFLQVYGGELVSAQADGNGLAIQTDYSDNFAELTVDNVNGIPKIKGGIYGIFSAGSASTGGIYSKPIGTGYDNIFASGYRRFRNEDLETTGEYPYAIGSSAEAAAENTTTGLAYRTVKQAVEDAARDAGETKTIMILRDVALENGVLAPEGAGTVTLDLNGHSLGMSGEGALGAGAGTTLKIDNSAPVAATLSNLIMDKSGSDEAREVQFGQNFVFSGKLDLGAYAATIIGGKWDIATMGENPNLRITGGKFSSNAWDRYFPEGQGYRFMDNQDDDRDIYPYYVGRDFTVEFDLNGHGAPQPASVSVSYGDKISEPQKPSAEGYVFDGWWTENGAAGSRGRQWNFAEDTVTADVTLYAKWDEAAAEVRTGDTWTSYPTVEEAFEKAGDGSTVILFKDAVLSETQMIDHQITLDLNGRTLSGKVDTYLLQINKKDFILKDSSADQTGRIENTGTDDYEAGVYSYAIALMGDESSIAAYTFTMAGDENSAYTVSGYNAIGAGAGYGVIRIRGGNVYSLGAKNDRHADAVTWLDPKTVIDITGGYFTGNIDYAGTGSPESEPSVTGGYYSSDSVNSYMKTGYGLLRNTEEETKEAFPYKVAQAYRVDFAAFTDSEYSYTAPVQYIPSGGKAVRPTPEPVREGYSFKGWIRAKPEETTYVLWDFDDIVSEDMTLWGRWEQITHTVSFHMNGHGTPIKKIENIPYGATVSEPETPAAAGYEFDGWWTKNGAEGDWGRQWNFKEDKVTSDVTLYAKWNRASSKLTRKGQSGEAEVRYFAKLKDAVIAAKDGDTVALLKDVLTDETIVIKKNITLDLAGHELSGDLSGCVVKAEETSLTVKSLPAEVQSSSKRGSIVNNSTSAQSYAITLDGNAAKGLLTFTVDNAEIRGYNAILADTSYDRLEMAAGKLTARGEAAEDGYTEGGGLIETTAGYAIAHWSSTMAIAISGGEVYGQIVYEGAGGLIERYAGHITGGKYNVKPGIEYLDPNYGVAAGEDEDPVYIFQVVSIGQKKYTVSYDANGGKFGDGKDTKSVTVPYGSTIEQASRPDAVYENKVLDGWYEKLGDDYYSDKPWDFDKDVVTEDITLRAAWSDALAEVSYKESDTSEIRETYKSFNDAVLRAESVATANSATLKLLANIDRTDAVDITLNNSGTTPAHLTFDLNGKTVSGDVSGKALLTLSGTGTLVITGESGYLTNDKGQAIAVSGGALDIMSGHFNGAISSDATLYGGEYDRKNNAALAPGHSWIYRPSEKDYPYAVAADGEKIAEYSLGEDVESFSSIDDAVIYANTRSGGTLKLVESYAAASDASYIFRKDVTIDLNGRSLSASNASDAIICSVGANLKVSGGADGTGSIVNSAGADAEVISMSDYTKKLDIGSGRYTGKIVYKNVPEGQKPTGDIYGGLYSLAAPFGGSDGYLHVGYEVAVNEDSETKIQYPYQVSIKKFTVKFDTNGIASDPAVENQTVEYGQKAKYVTAYNAKNAFEGWWTKNGTQQGSDWGAMWNFDTPITDVLPEVDKQTGTITLYAKWSDAAVHVEAGAVQWNFSSIYDAATAIKDAGIRNTGIMIKLLKDCPLDRTLSLEYDPTDTLTVDLSGKSLSGAIAGDSLIRAAGGGNLTITDSDTERKGSLQNTGFSGSTVLARGSDVVISGGRIKGSLKADNGKTVELAGGIYDTTAYGSVTGSVRLKADKIWLTRPEDSSYPYEVINKSDLAATYTLGTKTYTFNSLQTAVSYVNAHGGGTLKLEKDYISPGGQDTPGIAVTFTSDVTLDLNGREIQVKNDNTPAVKSDARITIKDSSTAQNGTVVNNGSGPALEVKFRSSDSRDLIISGGRFGGAVRYYDVPNGQPDAPVTVKADIYGGAFSVDPTSPATYGRDASTIDLSGILRAGYRVSASGSTPYRYIISNRYKVTLNIGTGGRFTDAGENPPAEKEEYYTYNSLIRQPGTEPLSSGTTLDGWFTESGKRWNFGADRVTSDMKLTARWGDIVAENGERKYADLQFAINEAVDGDTVTVTQKVALNGRLSINNKNSLTIDLNGYTLSNTSDASGIEKGLVVVSGCAQLTVTGGNGAIKNSAGPGMNITGGEITINSTNVTGTTGITVNHNQAITLNINDSTITGESLDGINTWSKQGIQNLQNLGAGNGGTGRFNINGSQVYGKGDGINGRGFERLDCDLRNTSCTGGNGCGVDTSGAGRSNVNVNGGALKGVVTPIAAGAAVAFSATGASLLGGMLGGGFSITPIIVGCTIGIGLLTGTLFALIFGSGDKGNQGKERYVDVEYDTNGGKPKIDPIKVLPGTQITIAGSKSTEKEGATLQKWSCSVDGKKYNPGSSYTVNVKTIFTAEYNYKITFSTEPAAISPLSQIVYEGTFATPPLLRKHDDNYVQKGESSGSPTWYEITSPLTSFDFIKPVHEHHDLVAGWEVRAQTYDAKSEIEEWYTLNEAVERANNWDKPVNEAVVVQLEDDFVTSLGKASNIRYYTYKFLKDTTLFLNDQSITENYFDVITVDSGAALKVLGGLKKGTIDSKKTAINVKDGSVTLMDNTYLTGEQVITIEGRGEVHISGATVEAKRVVKEHTPYALYVKNKDCKISGEITSGTISGKTNIGIADHSGFVLKGGLYTREAKESFVENNVALAPGMVWARAAGSDDMWTVEQFKEVARNKKKNKVYNSLQDALDDADSGDEIELLRDTKENIVSTDVKAADVKIDLGKHSVTGTFNNSFKADICNGSMIAAAGNAVVAAAEMIFERTPAVTVTGGVIANGGNAKITVAAEGAQINGAVTAKDGAKIIVTEDAKKAGIKGHLAAESNGSIELKAGLYTENVNAFCAEGYACLTNTDETTRTTYPYKVVPARKVQFDPDGGTPQPAAQTVEVGQPVSDPGAVTKESLTFYGWFVKKNDGSLGEKWNFAKRTVKADDPNPIVLKANLGDFTAYVEFISAEGVPVERYHTALKDAFAEAASAELPQTVKVVLLKDVTIETGNEISINTVKNYVFDLNGHRIQVNNPADPAISVSGKDLTLKIEHPDFGNEGDLFRIGNGAALTVGEGSGIRGRSYDENNLRIAVDGGSLRLEKGKYEQLTVNQNSGSLEFADGTYENLTVNQTNGSIVFKNGNYYVLKVMQGDGSVIFEDGTYRLVMAYKWNTAGTNRVLNVADGTFDNLRIDLFGEVTIQQGRIKDLNINLSDSKLHVNGGVYDNDSHNRLTEKAGNVILNPEKPEWVENKDVSTKAEYPWTLGIAPVAKNTTAGTEYDSLQKALDEAASGNEIKLLKDTKENIVSTDVKAADLKLDLGSRCITGTFANSFKIDMCNGSINGGGAQGAALTASADVTLQTAPGVEIISNVKAVNGAKISVTAEDTRIRGTLATASDAEHQGAASAIELKAGYYTQDVSAFCAENYVCKERTAEEKQEKYPEYGYQVVYGGYEAENVTKNIRYERLEQALLDGEEGNEIRLLKDIHNDKDYVNSVNDKLNLNGKVLECSTITFLAGAIIDTSKDHQYGGSGMIKTPGLLGTYSDGKYIQLYDDGADYVTDTLRKGWMPLYDEEEKGYRVWHYLTGYTKTSYGCEGRKLGLRFRIQFDEMKAYSYLAKGNSGLSYLTKLEWSPRSQKYIGDYYHNFKFNTDGLIREYGQSYIDNQGSFFDLIVYYNNYETELKGKSITLNGKAESAILMLPDDIGWVSKSVDIP